MTSTNRRLWERIDAGAAEGTAILAMQQQSGQGQWGRAWQSEPGGLYTSVALQPHCAVAEAGQLMLCITWGLATTLGYAGIPVQIKWFNDLVIGQRKLGGVLIETRVRQGRIAQAVVGLGLNWKNPVPETGITLQDVIATMPPTSRSGSSLGLSALEDWILEDIAAIALKSMMAGYRYWQEHGIQRILPAYEALLSRIGSRIHLDQGTGQILGVTAEGHLRVRMLESQDGSGQGSSPEDSEESMATLLQFQPGEIQLGYGE